VSGDTNKHFKKKEVLLLPFSIVQENMLNVIEEEHVDCIKRLQFELDLQKFVSEHQSPKDGKIDLDDKGRVCAVPHSRDFDGPQPNFPHISRHFGRGVETQFNDFNIALQSLE
jgi:hypothetical protein